ncbi:cytochrome P450 20A1-like isoform X2 [Dreissena polymorpha]|uniref:cytochrome P450 20A1-like isoform X2 n=1 Tax=Dreissena polymorpha TaxID=45954 RepID=UPI002263DA80|nr:cytochrome P450 20A1-like isoform X2 [Dreissena polymorpha]
MDLTACSCAVYYVVPFVIAIAILWQLLEWETKLKRNRNDGTKVIHGPRPSDPTLGNFPDIELAGGLISYLKRAHAQYGDVVQVWFGDKPVVSTASPGAFTDQVRLFDKPEMSFISPVFGSRSIQFVNGPEARERRRKYDMYLSKDAVHSHFYTFKQIADETTCQLGALEDPDHVTIYDVAFQMACRAVGVALFGEYFSHDDNILTFKALYEQFWPVLEKNFTSGLPEEGTDEIVQDVHHIVRSMIEDHVTSGTDRKFIDVVMESNLDQTTVYGDILVYLVGGFHSVSTTLTWCLYHAALYPQMQTRIHGELSHVLGRAHIQPSALPELKYLRWFIDETLRLRYVAPVATRLSGNNTKIQGYHVPEQTQIIHALGVVMNSETYWEHPERFNPERFDTSENSDKAKRSPLAFCPFGFAGRRMCPGKAFFYDEALIFLGTLIRAFEFSLAPETPTNMAITEGLLTRPRDKVVLKIKKRTCE